MFGKRILIAVPHPDDEIVACCAAIARARAEGAEIFALYLTHGCIARETLWPWQRKHYDAFVARRRAEAETVARFLGIRPVGWASRPARRLWRDLAQVCAEIEGTITYYGIDQLWIPAYEGGNPDHDGLNAVGSLLASGSGRNGTNPPPLAGGVRGGGAIQAESFGTKDQPQGLLNAPPPNLPREGGGTPYVLEFAEYNFFGGRARSQEFPRANGTEETLTLTPEEQREKSATPSGFMRPETAEPQLCENGTRMFPAHRAAGLRKAAASRHRVVCEVPLVPFRHPRVDFTKPQEVSTAIAKFLKVQG